MLCWSSRFQATVGIPISGCSLKNQKSVSAKLHSGCGPAWEYEQWTGLRKAAPNQCLASRDRHCVINLCTCKFCLQRPRQGKQHLFSLGWNQRNHFVSCKRKTSACCVSPKTSAKVTHVGRVVSSFEPRVKGPCPIIDVEPSRRSSLVTGAPGLVKAAKNGSDGRSSSRKASRKGLSDDKLSDGAVPNRKVWDGVKAPTTFGDANGRVSDEKALVGRASEGSVPEKGVLSSRASEGAKEGASKPSVGAGVPGRTLLERGTRLIKTSPKESRWGDANSEGSPPVQGAESGGPSSPPPKPLDAIFGPLGRGRPKPRFRREPQTDGATDMHSGGSPVSSSLSTIARPTPRERFPERDFGLYPSSGFLAGYDYDNDVAVPIMHTPPSPLGPSSEWVVETCPKCFGSAVVACDVCHASWPSGTCPKCKGKGYVACTNCKGSGTVYGSAQRAQPVKAQPPKPPVQSSEGETEEGPSLIEAFRIIKNERRSRSALSSADDESGEGGVTQKPHWLKGRPITEEHKRKISLALQGRPRPPLTPAHKKKLSDIRREFFEQPGARERWSEAAKKKRVMHCSICGLPGHSSRFCPESGFVKHASKPCRICGQAGHTRHGCPKRRNASTPYRCKNCGEYGHEVVNCPNEPAFEGRTLCELCGVPGHRNRECPQRPKGLILQQCSFCQQAGHNKRRCPERVRKG